MAIPALANIAKAGTAPTYGAPVASQDIACGDGVFLHVKNGNGAELTITFTDPGKSPYGSSVTNPTVTVAAATGDKMIPIPRTLAGSSGLVTAAFSVQSSVLCGLFRMPAVT